MRFSWLIGLALLCAPTAAAAQAPQGASAAEDARIRAVVRDYLLKNPEVIEEALAELERRRMEARREKVENDPRHYAIGPRNASVTIVEYFDYRCGFCKAALEWVTRVQRTRPDVRIVFKEFPVLGPSSLEASRAAIASLRQGGERYFRFHQALMTARGDLTGEVIDRLARQSGVDVARMRRDMNDPAIAKLIQDNYALGEEGDVAGTPAFMINGKFVYGFDEAALDQALREATAEARARRPG